MPWTVAGVLYPTACLHCTGTFFTTRLFFKTTLNMTLKSIDTDCTYSLFIIIRGLNTLCKHADVERWVVEG